MNWGAWVGTRLPFLCNNMLGGKFVSLNLLCARTCFSFAVPQHLKANLPKPTYLKGQRESRIRQLSVSNRNQDLLKLSGALENLSVESIPIPENPIFTKFSEMEAKQGLLLQFASDLFSASKKNDGMRRFFEVLRPTFAKALQSNTASQTSITNEMKGFIGQITKHDLMYKVAYNRELETYILSFNGRSDALMKDYAKKYQLPRGCPVLWRKGQFIDIRGFYPKFENDDRSQISEVGFDTQVFENACGLDFFLKWSGFLIQLFAFEIDGKYYWTVLSKQKADYESPFIQLGEKLLTPLMTYNLTKMLADNHLYIGAEGLSPLDNTHGYISNVDAALVTCIGQGTYFNSQTNENIFFDKQFVKYYTNYEIVEFCRKYNLLCDTARYVRGGKDSLSEFTTILFRRRDFMKFKDFEDAFTEFKSTYPDACHTLFGSADHRTVAGEILEGMVFGIVYSDGSRATEKVKLPFYTWRTMFLRSWFDDLSGRKKKDFNGKALRDLEFITAHALKKMEIFTRYWCTTTEGKMHFLKMMKAAAVILQCDGKVVDGQAEYTEMTDDLHVHLANQIENLELTSLEKLASRFDQIISADVTSDISPIVCCFVLGPIGAGKSTFSEKLVREVSDCAQHIDGDSVVHDNMTQYLHSERADATKSAIYRCILEGKHPVISTGGGVFDGFSVRKKLKDIFKRSVKIIVCIMKDVKTVQKCPGKYEIKQVDLKDIEKQLPQVYNTDVQYMKRIVTGRVNRREWADTSEYAKINEKSNKNIQFASQLLQQADDIFTIPFDTSAEYHKSPHDVISRKVTGIKRVAALLQRPFKKEGVNLSGNFTQIRALVSRTDSVRGTTCKHITLAYTPETFKANLSTYKTMEERLCEAGTSFTADVYGLTGIGQAGKKTTYISVAVLNGLNFVPYAHITESSGLFRPAMMKEVTKHILEARSLKKGKDFKLLPTNKLGESYTFLFDPDAFQTSPTLEPNKSLQKRSKSASFMQTVKYQFVDILLL